MSRTEPLDEFDESESEEPRGKRIRRYLREWGVGLLIAAAFYLILGSLRAPDLPEQAPDFTLPDLSGASVSLADFRGQTVVLNFWATWCGPCRAEVPTLSAFALAHPDIPVLGIAMDGTPNTLKAARETFGIQYPVLIASEAIKDAYSISALPTTVVVGPDGRVEAAHAGLITRPQLWWITR